MLYFDKLTMAIVLCFAIGLAWISVPPADIEPSVLEVKPISDNGAQSATYEITRRSERFVSANTESHLRGPLSNW